MLLDFQVANFRSYHSPKLFSLVASRQEELPENVMDAKGFDLRVLRSAAVYGANASGKSNLLHAIWTLGDLIRMGPDAARREEGNWPPVFALSEAASREPTRFEIDFLAQDEAGAWARYEYHLGILVGRVVDEWLNVYPAGGKRQRWFVREPADSVPAKLHFSKSLRGAHKSLKKVTPPEMPFLFAAQTFGHPQLSIPAKWIQRNCYNRFEHSRGTTADRCHRDPSFAAWVSEIMRDADLGIVGVQVERREMSQDEIDSRLPPEWRKIFPQMYQHKVSFSHRTASGTPVLLDMRDESEGTRRLFELLAPLEVALQQGLVVLVDEMSASLHPMLTQSLIEAFHNPKRNANGAQLVLTTHDISLLREDLFRRDQIWFTKKSTAGETELYSLHDFRPRNDVTIQKKYLSGRYGGLPLLGVFDFGRVDGAKEKRQEGQKRQGRKSGKGAPATGAGS